MIIPAASILFILATFPPALAPGPTALPDLRPAETASRGDEGDVFIEAVVEGAQPGVTTNLIRGQSYRVYVYALHAWAYPIGAAQWRLRAPPSHLAHITSAGSFGRPAPEVDFFNGQSMIFAIYDDFGAGLSGAILNIGEPDIEPGADGYLQYYDVYVDEAAPLGEFEFVIDNTAFLLTAEVATPGTIADNFAYRIVLPPCVDCVGDINEDGVVDLLDFSEFVLCYGSAGNDLLCDEQTMIRSDLVWDGRIDLNDFAAFAAYFGQCASGPDCNENDVDDACDVAQGTSLDCNGNLVPDECDIAAGTSFDCDGDNAPDECTLGAHDCNQNGLLDAEEIADDLVPDCNDNCVPDDCDISLFGASDDCNANGVPDDCLELDARASCRALDTPISLPPACSDPELSVEGADLQIAGNPLPIGEDSDQVFAWRVPDHTPTYFLWSGERLLRADPLTAARRISADLTAVADGTIAELRGYNGAGLEVAAYDSPPLLRGERRQLFALSPAQDIAWFTAGGSPTLLHSVDADAANGSGDLLNDLFSGIGATLRATTFTGSDLPDPGVYALDSAAATTGARVFAHTGNDPLWPAGRTLRIDLAEPVSTVTVQVRADTVGNRRGLLRAMDFLGGQILVDQTPDNNRIPAGEVRTLRVEDNQNRIRQIRVCGVGADLVYIDNLRIASSGVVILSVAADSADPDCNGNMVPDSCDGGCP